MRPLSSVVLIPVSPYKVHMLFGGSDLNLYVTSGALYSLVEDDYKDMVEFEQIPFHPARAHSEFLRFAQSIPEVMHIYGNAILPYDHNAHDLSLVLALRSEAKLPDVLNRVYLEMLKRREGV